MVVQKVTDGSWVTKVVKEPKPVLVDFWADWCGPCRALSPILDEIAEEFSGRVFVMKLNVDQNMSVAGNQNVLGLPTLKLFKGGKPVAALSGLQSKRAIVKLIEENI